MACAGCGGRNPDGGGPAADDEPDDDIDAIELRIDTLAAEVRRCRKFALAARILIAGGATGIALLSVGALTFTPELMIVAMAAVIGGVVLLGSNASTWDENDRALLRAEALRTELIAALPLRVVGRDDATTLH